VEDAGRRLPEGVGVGDAALRAPLGRPALVAGAEQCRLARSPGYLEAHLATLRALVSPAGQREVLLDRLPLLEVPTLAVWGERDRVFPESQGRGAAARLREGSLELIPDCGHLPHAERPDAFVAALGRFHG
jgi:pimeloyl-ACP methyl ester carboxylesterase